MKRLPCLVLGFLFLCAAQAGPQDGGFAFRVAIPAGTEDNPGAYNLERKITFVAGQRACVIVIGQNDGVTSPLSVLIRDEKGKIVASDQGAYNLAAIWYPNRDMTCTIHLRNPDSHEHEVFVAVK